ncbi:hypothetical protein B0H67DRAFT_156464 [Lasiosphaeris hirsuta]|uniref:Uncharacterized protein n=1 Tax=Lasiosphaeris hirsuta TaxID=260670 RepID=A0AA40E0A2_9PEZI|nr:hypothetical protein B0H67DRAFT_156464 [Lasiosphaeris hirsuta]
MATATTICSTLPKDIEGPQPCYIQYAQGLLQLPPALVYTASPSLLGPSVMADSGYGSRSPIPPPPPPTQPHYVTVSSARDSEMMQALDIARDSFEGAQEPRVCEILEKAIARIWAKVLAGPDTYVMTRNEFAVFNYFQARFKGNQLAVAARGRYWENTYGQ